jgi:hypothetical protein
MINRGDQSGWPFLRSGRIKPAKNRLISADDVLLFERAGKRYAPLEAGGNCPSGQKNDSVLC